MLARGKLILDSRDSGDVHCINRILLFLRGKGWTLEGAGEGPDLHRVSSSAASTSEAAKAR